MRAWRCSVCVLRVGCGLRCAPGNFQLTPLLGSSGFDALLATNDMSVYSARCAEVAAALNEVSQEVNTAAAELRAAGRQDLFEVAASLQQHEKEHLRLEATVQVLRKEHAAGRWSWQQAVTQEAVDPTDGTLRPPWATNRTCRVHVDSDTGLSVPSGCQCGAAEPTKEEYEAAHMEATQALQRVLQAINDACSELRETLVDE